MFTLAPLTSSSSTMSERLCQAAKCKAVFLKTKRTKNILMVVLYYVPVNQVLVIVVLSDMFCGY